ncbi:MAG: hypothetical protein LIO77_06700 [Rikenellaceae bacterium]|nr:hypothetical protein [Rikenellaceae bacterium]
MDGKLQVKICTGTLCYVMGGAELQLIDEHIPQELLPFIEVSGAPCLDVCEKKAGSAPFAKVGDKLISQASINQIVAAIRDELKVSAL